MNNVIKGLPAQFSIEIYSVLFRYALSLTKNQMEAEDLLHGSLLKCFATQPNIFSTKKGIAYAISVVKHSYIDEKRKAKRDLMKWKTRKSDWHTINERLIELETIERFVEMGYVSLTETQKNVFAFMMELGSDKEVAQKLGTSVNTVRVLKTKVRTKIKKAVKENQADFDRIFESVKYEYH